MMTSPSFDGGWDNNMSSKGTMEALLAPEDAFTSPSHDPCGQSTTNHTIQPSSDKECQLGVTFLMPVGECIAHMALNTAPEDALLEHYTRFKWLLLVFYQVQIIQGWQEPLQVVVIKIWTQLLFLKELPFGKPFHVVTTRLAKGKHITNLEPKARGRMLYMHVHNPYVTIYWIVLVVDMT